MQVDVPTLPTKRPAPWKMALNIALPLGLLAIFAWKIHQDWPAIRAYDWSVNWTLAGSALALLLLNSLMEIAIWNRTLAWFADSLPFQLAAPVYIWSSLARYIPGKVASLAVRVALTTEVKRDVIPVLASSTVELALRTASGLLLFLMALFAFGITQERSLLIAPLIIIPLVLVCAHPKIMLPVMNWALKKINQPTITHSLRYREVLLIFLATVARWVIYGMAFALIAWAIFPTAAHHLPVLVGTASGSWAAGFIGMSPGGVGIAEWIQKIVLQQALHFPASIGWILPVLFRLATLVAEGTWALISVFFWRQRHVA